MVKYMGENTDKDLKKVKAMGANGGIPTVVKRGKPKLKDSTMTANKIGTSSGPFVYRDIPYKRGER